MGRAEHAVTLRIDDSALSLRVGTPKHEHHVVTIAVDHLDGAIRELLPPPIAMRGGPTALHRQYAVEQQNTLINDGGSATPGRTEKHRPWACPGPW